MLLRSILPVLLLLLTLPAIANAEADRAMRNSIKLFFAQGVYLKSARAELVEVLRWPDTTGKLHWRMPDLNNHRDHLSLIAEQGYGKTLRRWYVPVRLNWWARAVVAKRELSARSRLTADMLDTARVNVAGHSGSWWQETAGLVGTRLTRHLQAGDIIYASYIHRPKLIKRGDQVTMIASYGIIKVTAVGKVLRSAGIGDRVSIRNIKSRKIVQGIVTSSSTVRIITGATL